MTDASFSPFRTHLDQDRALRILRDALTGADDGELFLERSRSEALVFDDGRLRTASYDAEQGFGLRAVRGEVTGYAHSTEIDEASLAKAAETVRLAVGAGGGTLALPPKATSGRFTPPSTRPRRFPSQPASRCCVKSTLLRAGWIHGWCRSRPASPLRCKRWRFCGPRAGLPPISGPWLG